MTVLRVLLGVVLCVVTASCTRGSSPSPNAAVPASPNPSRAELIRAADLDRCPPSREEAVEGGLPDVTLPCLGRGPDVHLAGLVGKPLVLNIWGSWCGPCQKETPYFAAAYDDLKGQVRFLGVDSVDDPDSALDFAAHVDPPMRYPSVVDDNRDVLVGLHGPITVPSTVFVAADGTVVKQVAGDFDSGRELRAAIARYLGVDR